MIRVEFKKNEVKYFFLYVTQKVRISTDNPDSFNHEYRDGATVQIDNVWTYFDATKDSLFTLSLLTQHTEDVINALQILKADGGSDED
ncbi:UNVERIFIED_ORG: hypothetical protein FHW05_002217 [Pantoea agglomerans]